MRQFLTWQFWLSLAALAAVTIVLVLVTRSSESSEAALVAAPLGETGETDTKSEQPIDLIVLVFAAQADEGFDFVDGRSTARVIVYIDGFRYMDIPAGTPGENRCSLLDKLAQCVVAADVLGDAVLWFSLLPLEAGNQVTLPGIADVLDGAKVRLDNGWVVSRVPVITRDSEDCGTDTVGLNDFLERFADQSTSTYSIEEQAITDVTCVKAS